MTETTSICTVRVRGFVQGVGFRWWVGGLLRRQGLAGSATNLDDGSVEIVVRGDAAACERLVVALRGPDAPGRVDSVEVDRQLPGAAPR